MVLRLFLLLLGFGLAVSGGVSVIIYLNLLTTGLSLSQFFVLMFARVECYLFIIGLLLITTSIYLPSYWKKEED
ncbi:hypothetical protein [Bacillus sp. 2205SS5-2]|uniref:hypothetical protein n=1 Tax=Bacillus sp. 2205SS5-2 TaxID=3109031 RepID=UPI003005CA56